MSNAANKKPLKEKARRGKGAKAPAARAPPKQRRQQVKAGHGMPPAPHPWRPHVACEDAGAAAAWNQHDAAQLERRIEEAMARLAYQGQKCAAAVATANEAAAAALAAHQALQALHDHDSASGAGQPPQQGVGQEQQPQQVQEEQLTMTFPWSPPRDLLGSAAAQPCPAPACAPSHCLGSLLQPPLQSQPHPSHFPFAPTAPAPCLPMVPLGPHPAAPGSWPAPSAQAPKEQHYTSSTLLLPHNSGSSGGSGPTVIINPFLSPSTTPPPMFYNPNQLWAHVGSISPSSCRVPSPTPPTFAPAPLPPLAPAPPASQDEDEELDFFL